MNAATEASVAEADVPAFDHAARCQITAHAVSLAMQNAVAQQQHAFTLLNAVTAAAARAVLDGKIEEAQMAAQVARELLDPSHLVETLSGLHDLMDRLADAPKERSEPA